MLQVVDHSPADSSVQVEPDVAVVVQFDGVINPVCLREAETWLKSDSDPTPVEGSFQTFDDGRSVRFEPTQPLREDASYTFQLSAFTCDVQYRLLEERFTFRFRTIDRTAPAVVRASVSDAATGVDREGALVVTFDEVVAPDTVNATSVELRDDFGNAYPCAFAVDGAVATIDPDADLPGDRQLTLTVGSGVEDLVGNRMDQPWSVGFRTAVDTVPPRLVGIWPGPNAGLSPRLEPELYFDEPMDPDTIEVSTVTLEDEFGNFVDFTAEASPDGRTIHILPAAPLISGRSYELAATAGPGSPTDLSGNPLSTSGAVLFHVGTDSDAPGVTASEPTSGTGNLGIGTRPLIRFDEPLDPGSVDRDALTLTAGGQAVAFDVRLATRQDAIRIEPRELLEPATTYLLTLRGGRFGVRDFAGNRLASDVRVEFTTHSDGALPRLIMLPPNGAIAVPIGVTLAVLSDEPLDPATVDADTVTVTDSGGERVAGTIELDRGDRVIRFTPQFAWDPGGWYTFRLVGGPDGLRKATGNRLIEDRASTFRIGQEADTGAPRVNATLNAIDDLRKDNLTVPPHGFDIDVAGSDVDHFSLDMTSAVVRIRDGGAAPSSDEIFAAARVDGSTLNFRVPEAMALAPGSYTLEVQIADLSGNVGASEPLPFRVADPDPRAVPFEITQVAWIRFDLDRDGNGRPDLDDDLLRLGLIAEGDPLGTNARLAAIVRDGIVARTHELFHRGPIGERRSDSVAVLLTHTRPLGVPALQIACAGLDPEGDPNRGYGSESTGTLGRAFFDYGNARFDDVDTGTRPGVGVFPGELFLFESKIHQGLYPSFVTTFARRFLPLSPPLGGTAAGAHAADAAVLASDFDYDNATSVERARFDTVFRAADDWATAIGTILAHEIGHTVGLTAAGGNPFGLHGDASLHNAMTSLTDVMASAVGYQSLVSLEYGFRDLNIAYLRHRVLMK